MAMPLRRPLALVALWRVWRTSRRPGAPSVGTLLRTTPRMLAARAGGRYREISAGRVFAMVVALAYLISPIDLVPEGLLAFLGLADDAVVAAWLAGAVLDETSRFVAWERMQRVLSGPGVRARGR
jgi:uncharacterized membrane protein YkvA (DUF1232 family)